ncbi:MAG: radical SAM family heme chaperone HemW [Opitutaceae bacterium]|nr:radical SAM family heme chaperone HemW [Opitutaceae bacterium]
MAIRENAGKASGRGALGLYIHVPFCASTCDFCAFYQDRPTPEAIETYLQGIQAEAQLVDWARPVDTVFMGGGTPGLLAADDLRRLGALVHPRLGGKPLEWSIELAPGSVTVERLRALKEIGVTRISMGVQTFRKELLDALNRRHGPEQIHRAYDRIRSVGFDSVNIDLMFALPGQAEEEWLEDLHQAIGLKPDHVSTYCLTFEEDTALWVKLSQGKVKLDPEREAALYERTWSALEAAGYPQYEVSNFARDGHACIHNLNTWRMQEWVGLGPSASSQHQGRRGTNIADLVEWRRLLVEGRRSTEDAVELTDALLAEDSVIFGLRMNEGVDLAEVCRRFPGAPSGRVDLLIDRLVGEGLALRRGTTVKLTLRGRLVADAIGGEILHAYSTP